MKDILTWIALSGAIYIAASSPYFVTGLMKGFLKGKNYKKKNVSNIFYRLRKEGCIEVKKHHHQIYISLTELGKKKAGRFQIDALKVKKPKKWDNKWRLVIFDIPDIKRSIREALRGKLRELGFYPLQKSVWIHPYNCKDEIDLLRNFLGVSHKEIRLVVAERLENDNEPRKAFKLD